MNNATALLMIQENDCLGECLAEGDLDEVLKLFKEGIEEAKNEPLKKGERLVLTMRINVRP